MAVPLAGLMVAAALPAHAVNIPEGGAVTPDSASLIHFRVTSTCDAIPMDMLEVTIPEGVTNPIPEAVPGWDVVVEVPEPPADEAEAEDDAESSEGDAEAEDDAEPTVVRWTGGLLDDGNLLDFGMRARFPDEEGEILEFPVIQGCGLAQEEHAPTVTLAQRYGNKDIAEISDDVDQLRVEVDELRADVDRLQEQVGDVNVVNLRGRVSDNEKAVKDLDERVTTLEDGEAEPSPEPEE